MIDQQQLAPMVCRLDALPKALGAPRTLLANSGCFSAAIVEACTAAGIEPLNAEPALGEAEGAGSPFIHLRASASPAPDNPTSVEAMAHRLAPEGKIYALRQQTPEPVFGTIKTVLGSNSSRCQARQGPRRTEPRCPGLKHQAHVRPERRFKTADRSLPRNPGASDIRRRSGQCTQAPNRPPTRLHLSAIAAQLPSPTFSPTGC